MRNKERITAFLMAVAMGIMNIGCPGTVVSAEQMTDGQNSEAETEPQTDSVMPDENGTEAAADTAGSGEQEDPAYIIVAENGADAGLVQELCEDATVITSGSEESAILFVEEDDIGPAELQELDRMDNVVVEENFIMEAAAADTGKEEIDADADVFEEFMEDMTDDTETVDDTVLEWNMQMIHTPTDWTPQREVKVAVLDSGIDWSGDVQVAGRLNLVDGADAESLYEDGTGHGTGIASLIASQIDGTGIRGMNPYADIYSVKVLDGSNRGPVSRIIEGIRWCIDEDMDMIQMSFGTPSYSAALEAVLQEAHDAGILLVASAGNTGAGVTYPAAYDTVLSVGSVGADASVSEFSAVGDGVDIYAPGEQICAGSLFGGVMAQHGTSLAAAQVTGAASILMAGCPELSADAVSRALCMGARPLEGAAGGLLDVQYAMDNREILSACTVVETEGEGTPAEESMLPEESTEEQGSLADGNVSANPQQPETYDVDYVEGQWSQKNHEILVEKWAKDEGDAYGLTESDLNLLKEAVQYPDKLKNGEAEVSGADRVLGGMHAAGDGNYIAYFRYYFKLGSLMNKGDSYAEAVARIQNTAGVDMATVTRVKDILFNEKLCPEDKNDKHSRAIKFIGVAIHLGGDIFAHKTLVHVSDYEEYRGNNKGEPELTDDERSDMNANKMSTQQFGVTHGHAKIADNVNFMPKRYEVGVKRLNNQVIKQFLKKDTTYHSKWLNPSLVRSDYTYSLLDYDKFNSVVAEGY